MMILISNKECDIWSFYYLLLQCEKSIEHLPNSPSLFYIAVIQSDRERERESRTSSVSSLSDKEANDLDMKFHEEQKKFDYHADYRKQRSQLRSRFL